MYTLYIIMYYYYVLLPQCTMPSTMPYIQYYAMRIPTDRGAWWATLHGVAKTQT